MTPKSLHFHEISTFLEKAQGWIMKLLEHVSNNVEWFRCPGDDFTSIRFRWEEDSWLSILWNTFSRAAGESMFRTAYRKFREWEGLCESSRAVHMVDGLPRATNYYMSMRPMTFRTWCTIFLISWNDPREPHDSKSCLRHLHAYDFKPLGANCSLTSFFLENRRFSEQNSSESNIRKILSVVDLGL